ncbi:MAG TPA: inner membrane CreD family protein, partial [Usitatibacter sp.]|nr:inner membrane CreD family protein [Usitatibacter sp.]
MQVPPLLARTLAVSAVATLLLVPIGMIAGKVGERRARAQQVVAEFASEATGPQVVAGPLLVLTCEETFSEERVVKRYGRDETVEEKKTAPCPSAFFPPQTLAASAAMPVETRYRGIYPVRLYHASIRLSGRFAWPAPAPWNGINPRAWKKAYVVLQVSDARGIKSVASTISPGAAVATDAGLDARFAIQHALGEYPSSPKGADIEFDYQLQLDGTSSLRIAPVGDSSEI